MSEVELANADKSIFSRGGEDSVLVEIFRAVYGNLLNKNRYFVDIGVQDAVNCNTRLLREKFLWDGLFIDARNSEHAINLRKEHVTTANILNVLAENKVPDMINCFSIDIGYNDFYILKKVLTAHTMDVVVINYNASHSPQDDKIVEYSSFAQWDGTSYFGASLLSLCKLMCGAHNYSLVYCDKSGASCFFVHNSLLYNRDITFKNKNDIDKLYKQEKVGNGEDRRYVADNLNREFITYEQAMRG